MSEDDPSNELEKKRILRAAWRSQQAATLSQSCYVLIWSETGYAIALDYDSETCPVPVIVVKAFGDAAWSIKSAAEESDTFIFADDDLAKNLYEHGNSSETVPEETFDEVATAILFAKRKKDEK